MKTKRRATRARLAAIGVAAASAVLVAGCSAANERASPDTGLSGTISGAGATSQEAAQRAWKATFEKGNSGATVDYAGVGSGGGRTQFIEGGVAFAGSDAYLEDDELQEARQRCGGQVIEIPNYVSPIAIAFNLPGIRQLNLSPATVAGIFKGQITQWNAPQIAADNPGVALPNTRVNPVHRADDSGTTENFTDYLNKTAPQIWTDKADGEWPLPGGEAAQGTSGIRDNVSRGVGSIGYVDASQAGQLGTAKVKVGNQFVGPTPEAAAKIFGESERVEGQGPQSFAYEINRTASGSAYPVVLVSYALACPQYPDAAQADLTKAYLKYVISQEGQRIAAQHAGAAPIPDQLRRQIDPVLNGVRAAQG